MGEGVLAVQRAGGIDALEEGPGAEQVQVAGVGVSGIEEPRAGALTRPRRTHDAAEALAEELHRPCRRTTRSWTRRSAANTATSGTRAPHGHPASARIAAPSTASADTTTASRATPSPFDQRDQRTRVASRAASRSR